jgi:leader peptidase (prepilin peptidase)/N-methyltransferase
MISLSPIILAVKFPVIWALLALGACIGSFLNVCILRIPEGTFFKHARSVCPSCGKKIPFFLNIPIFGFLMLRGRAACCGARLSWQYPLIELMTALIFAALYLRFPFLGWSQTSVVVDLPVLARYGHAAIFISLMLVMSVIDARLMIIPDVLSLGMILLSPVVVWLHPDLTWRSSILGVFAGGGILYMIAWGYWLIRKQYGLGFGDVKLLAAIGGWLGWQAVFPSLFLGSVVGSILALVVMFLARSFSWQAKIPFGPYLAAGAVAHLILGPELFVWLSGG